MSKKMTKKLKDFIEYMNNDFEEVEFLNSEILKILIDEYICSKNEKIENAISFLRSNQDSIESLREQVSMLYLNEFKD
jgi:hypothetical protein